MHRDVAAFGDAVWRTLGFRPSDDDLAAALGAVAFRAKQASSKLSPVEQEPRRADGRRSGPKPVAPFCSATFASFATCPGSCCFLTDPLTGKRRGCFVSANVNSMRLMNRLDASAARVNTRIRGTLIGLAEAFAIDSAFPDGVPQDGPGGRGRILRVHVAGDAANEIVAAGLAAAVDRWYARGGGRAWAFTHRWRTIPRRAWGAISVFARVETSDAARAAIARGYAPAITQPSFTTHVVHELVPGGPRVLPCPAEEDRARPDGRPITCASCRWCFDDSKRLRDGVGVGFRIHSHQSAAARGSVEEVVAANEVVRRRLRVL